MNRFLTNKALSLYTAGYADSYRQSDDEYKSAVGDGSKFGFVKTVRATFDHSISVVDLGCGTGRYHHIFKQGDCITGIDASAAMLKQARNPVGALKAEQFLCEADINTVVMPTAYFDLVLCMGVFGSQMPLSLEMALRAFDWLKPKGIFAFDVVKHCDNPCVTLKSSIAERLRPFTFGIIKDWFDAKLMGFTMNEAALAGVLERAKFSTWKFEPIQGKGHDDLLVVARK